MHTNHGSGLHSSGGGGGWEGIPYHRIPYPLDTLHQPPDTLPPELGEFN